MNNEEIAEKIKLARKERDLTQGDLAKHLNRTASNVSDIERSRVQISAVDLFSIARFLNKPIEYFYGEEFLENDIQDLIAVIRKQPPEARKQSIKTTKLVLEMQQMEEEVLGNNRQPTLDEMTELFKKLGVFSDLLNGMNNQVIASRNMLVEYLNQQGKDIS